MMKTIFDRVHRQRLRASAIRRLRAPSLALVLASQPLLATPGCTAVGGSTASARSSLTSESDPRWQLLEIGHAKLRVRLEPEAFGRGTQPLFGWARQAALTVHDYYGSFPAPAVDLYIASFEGEGVGHGRVILVRGRPTVLISVGDATTDEELHDDWVLTHELIHLGFPTVPDRHHWIEEGLATYGEVIARARAGITTEQDVWREWMESMHHGLPEPGDRGLDYTPTWGRTYWGGALFCLLADIEIRKQSNNRQGLRQAVRAIVENGGSIDQEWALERALAVGDRALGAPVLQDLYQAMRADPVPVDLEALWRELGVDQAGGNIAFDDGAPLAAVRRELILGD